MLKFIRALHITGAVVFFGSILGHAITGLAEGVHDNAQTYLLTRQIVDIATWYLTLPGLVLLTLTGIALVVMRERPIRHLRPHLFIVALILLNAVFILLPTGQAILSISSDLAAGSGSNSELSVLQEREAMFGAANILLCLVAVFVGVIKPGGGKE